jgi:predicted AlkP superfamily phosphohydrolase/phosphomutase
MNRIFQFAAVCSVGLLLAGCSRPKPAANGKRIIILGVDAMDPGFLEQHWDALPNLNRLRQMGGFTPLATTVPPQSPTAWSTVSTGLDPGGTGIFDFILRDPKTMTLVSSMADVEPSSHTLSIGPYILPLSKGKELRFLHGETFWQALDKAGIPSIILRMPNNFPPVKSTSDTLSGMGTPDIRGTYGTFTFYTDDPQATAQEVAGGEIVPVYVQNDSVALTLGGPINTLRKDQARSTITIHVHRDPDHAAALFDIDGQKIILKQGEWSNWIHVEFPIIPGVKSAAGMVRIYAKKLNPEFQIYISPVNIDPGSPELPISTPANFSRDLARAIGPFYTQGIAEDTAAFRAHVLTRQEYEHQANFVSQDEFRMMNYELDRFHRGILFLHFSTVDTNSHMLWGKYDADLLKTYQTLDGELGYIMKTAPDAIIIVMSDHGFNDFNRAVNLNTWLYQNGFLALDDPKYLGAPGMLSHVDWKHTLAYSVGINSLYLNLAGREKYGIVPPAMRDQISDRIIAKLEQLRDPKNGDKAVYTVYRTDQIYHGSQAHLAPDMVVGWAKNYRSSWETALGEIPKTLISDNDDEWRADHCIAAEMVPGVFISNRPLRLPHPWLADVPVTLLHEFGVAPLPGMGGHNMFQPENNNGGNFHQAE